MLTSQCCVFLLLSWLYLTNRYQASASLEGLETRPDFRRWTLSTMKSFESTKKGTASPSYHDITELKLDQNRLDRDATTRRAPEATISNKQLENLNQKEVLLTPLLYRAEFGRNGRLDHKHMKKRHNILTKSDGRTGVGTFTVLFSVPSPGNNATGKEAPVHDAEEENQVPSFHLNVTIPKLYLCIHICLAHTLCTGGVFHGPNSSCNLKDKIDDIKSQELRSKGGKVHHQENNDLKIFTVNSTALMHLLGKCTSKPCSNETFCSHSQLTGYRCLPLGMFLRRLQKKNVPVMENHKGFLMAGRYGRRESTSKNGSTTSSIEANFVYTERGVRKTASDVIQRSGLVRKKRSLSQQSGQLKRRQTKKQSKVDCGFPPELPKALSLYTTTHLGSMATYFCEEGIRTHTTQSTIFCQSNGKWSQPKFHCVPKSTCKIPPTIPSARMHFSEVDGNETIKYECMFPPHETKISFCDPRDGTWSHVELDCSQKRRGNKTSSWKIPDMKNRKFSKTKNRRIVDKTVKQNRASKTLNGLVHLQKRLKNLDVLESEDGKKSTGDSKNKKHSQDTKSSKRTANKAKVNVPKTHPDSPQTKSSLKVKKSINLKRSITKNPIKPRKNNSEKLSSFVYHKNSSQVGQKLTKRNKAKIKKSPRKNKKTSDIGLIFTQRPRKINTKLKNPNITKKTPNSFNSSQSISLSGKSAGQNLTAKQGASNDTIKHHPVGRTNITHNNKTLQGAAKSSSNLDSKSSGSERKKNLTSQDVISRNKTGISDDMKIPGRYNGSAIHNATINGKNKENNTENYPLQKTFDNVLKSKYIKEPSHLRHRGVIRADVNARVGVRGFMCIRPGKITLATSSFRSTRVGSKAIFKCEKYFFAHPVPYCPLVTCLKNGIWSELFLSCSDLDCINPPTYYEGRRICSSSGYKCRRWDEVLTAHEGIVNLHFPEGNISLAKNFCRDPFKQGTPWCFTEDPTVIWDYCDIPLCP